MAKKFVQPGVIVTVTAPAARTSGQGVLVGKLFGVAIQDAASGAPLPIGVMGVFTIAADNALVISAGDLLYWDAANNWVDKTATAQERVGVAAAAKVSTGTEVDLLLGGGPTFTAI